MELFYNSPVGHRIRYYRLKAGLTQKQLAELCGLTEPAVRNYELCNRIPSHDSLLNIANALGISIHTIEDPELNALGGALHTLFRLEQAHALSPVIENGRAVLKIQNNDGELSYMEQMLMLWGKARELYDKGIWSLAEYETWKSIYPYTCEAALRHPLNIQLSEYTLGEIKDVPAEGQLPERKPQKRKRKPKKPEKV